MGTLIVIVLIEAAFGGLGAWIAGQKRRSPVEGLILGVVFGPVGAIVEALLPLGDRIPQPRAAAPEQGDGPEPDWKALGVSEKPKPKGSLEGWRLNQTLPKESEPPPGAFDWVDRKTLED
jgi:hypothetical protein